LARCAERSCRATTPTKIEALPAAPSRPDPLSVTVPVLTSSSSKVDGGVTVTVMAALLTTTLSHPVGLLEMEKVSRFEAVKWTVTGSVSPSEKKMAGSSNASDPVTSSLPHEMKRAAASTQHHPANLFIFIVYLLNFNSKNRCKDTKKRDKFHTTAAIFASGTIIAAERLTNSKSI